MEDSGTLCQLLFDDLRELQCQGLPETLACVYRYPNDSHHKGFSGIVVQNALGWSPVEVFSVVEDETVTDCFTYSTVTGPTEGLAIHQLRMTLMQHTIFLAALLGVERKEIVSRWMVALAQTDVGYTPGSLAVFGTDGITKGTFAAVPNVIKGSIVLLTILTNTTESASQVVEHAKPLEEAGTSEVKSSASPVTEVRGEEVFSHPRSKRDWLQIKGMTNTEWNSLRRDNADRCKRGSEGKRKWKLAQSLCSEYGIVPKEFAAVESVKKCE